MQDPRVKQLAKLIVSYSIEVRHGQLIAITARPPAAPLIEALYLEILEAGGQPYYLARGYPPFVPGLGDLGEILIKNASKDQLEHVDMFYKKVIDEFDGLISIGSANNTKAFANINPSKLSAYMHTHQHVQHTYMKRMSSGDLRRLLTLYPSNGLAQDAEMSLTEYEDFVFSAMHIDSEDPVAEWKNMYERQQQLVDWLENKDELEIKGPNVDLDMSIRGRSFINAAGKVNLPDGEIFTGPVEDSVTGHIEFSYPDYGSGREITGIKLTFSDGKVVEATAEKNEECLLEMLDTDRGSRYIGELGIGTNNRISKFSKIILFDEKLGGTIHIALGNGYPNTGSKNASAIHWDLLCDMKDGGQIIVDGELFYESGEFLI